MRRSLIALGLTVLGSSLCAAADAAGTAAYSMWTNIPVTNLEKSTKFYSDVFGLKVGLIVPRGAAVKDAKEIVLSPQR